MAKIYYRKIKADTLRSDAGPTRWRAAGRHRLVADLLYPCVAAPARGAATTPFLLGGTSCELERNFDRRGAVFVCGADADSDYPH